MNPLVLKYVPYLVLVVAIAYGGKLLYDAGYTSAEAVYLQADKDRAENLNAKLLDAQARASEKDKQLAALQVKLRKKARVITKEVVKIVKAPEFRCPVPDDGVRILNKARAGINLTDDP